MLFGDNTRRAYSRCQLIETICQLRFPAILAIGTSDPAQFQESIRSLFPRYVLRQDQQPPKVVNGRLETPPAVANHNFISADGRWKVNLTRDFVALSTLSYTRWEDFAQKLDKVLASFIQLYQPAFFQRIGLRYVNAFSRRALGLEDELWDDLIESPFIGGLSEPDVDEKTVSRSSLEMELALTQERRVKIHTGPGMLKSNGKQAPEVRFILDGDFSTLGQQLSADRIAGELGQLHEYAVRLFNAATTQTLKDAMGPEPME